MIKCASPNRSGTAPCGSFLASCQLSSVSPISKVTGDCVTPPLSDNSTGQWSYMEKKAVDREEFRPMFCQLLLFCSRGRNHLLRTCMGSGEPPLHTWDPPRAPTCLCCRADEGTRRHSEEDSTVFWAAMSSHPIAPQKPQTSTG